GHGPFDHIFHRAPPLAGARAIARHRGRGRRLDAPPAFCRQYSGRRGTPAPRRPQGVGTVAARSGHGYPAGGSCPRGGRPLPAIAAGLLEKSAEADDPAEGYGMLAMAYARMNPPDLDKAEKAARHQLDQALRTNDARLQASARFRLGELDLKLKKIKEGRGML